MSGDLMTRDEILRSNQTLRLWASGLRDWAGDARRRAAAERQRSSAHHVARAEAGQAPPEGGLPSLGDVKVSELFTVLVEQHGFGVMEAVRALARGMMVSGYPPDHDVVSAADAFDIVDTALQGRG